MDSPANQCCKCHADLEVVGVTATVRHSVMYMGNFGEGGMKRVAEVGGRKVDDVTCRACGTIQPAEFAEALLQA